MKKKTDLTRLSTASMDTSNNYGKQKSISVHFWACKCRFKTGLKKTWPHPLMWPSVFQKRLRLQWRVTGFMWEDHVTDYGPKAVLQFWSDSAGPDVMLQLTFDKVTEQKNTCQNLYFCVTLAPHRKLQPNQNEKQTSVCVSSPRGNRSNDAERKKKLSIAR